jgi:hypothetical protein
MAQTARKLNFMIAEDIARELEELVPLGKRSRVVSEAISKELAHIRRQRLTERLMSLRSQGPVIPEAEILASLKKDRARKQP